MNWKVFFAFIGIMVGGYGVFAGWAAVCMWVGDHVGRHVGAGLFMGAIVVLLAACAGHMAKESE